MFQLTWTNLQFMPSDEAPSEEEILGLNTVAGELYMEKIPQYEFFLGPFTHLSTESFLPKQPYYNVLQTFFEYFVPLEAEIKTTFNIHKNKQEVTEQGILGYNFAL